MGRFLTKQDMAIVKRKDAIRNSMVKRGEIDESDKVRFQHVVCGCGAVGCVFISARKGSEYDRNNVYY